MPGTVHKLTLYRNLLKFYLLPLLKIEILMFKKVKLPRLT